MLATAIRIDAGLEADVRAVVVVDDGIGLVFEELRLRRWFVRVIPVQVAFERDLFKRFGGLSAAPRA